MYTFIYFTLFVFRLQQKLFSQNATKLRGWYHPYIINIKKQDYSYVNGPKVKTYMEMQKRFSYYFVYIIYIL